MNYYLIVSLTITALLCGMIAPNVNAQGKAGTHPYAPDRALTEPTIFASGTISTGDFDSHPAFTPDGRTIYFLRSTPNFNLWTILVSRFDNGEWKTPEVVQFSGQYSDADPFITPDGSRFYFISNRPVEGKANPDLDIWMMDGGTKETEGTQGTERRKRRLSMAHTAEPWRDTLTSDLLLYLATY